MSNDEIKWEQYGDANSGLCRIKVDGGWLYEGENGFMTFVPDIDLKRYESHLRDAYKKGYEDGHSDGKAGFKIPIAD